MDRETLLTHRELWTEEPPECRSLEHLAGLDEKERALYDDLRADRLGERVRPEQERVRYDVAEQAVRKLTQESFREKPRFAGLSFDATLAKCGE